MVKNQTVGKIATDLMAKPEMEKLQCHEIHFVSGKVITIYLDEENFVILEENLYIPLLDKNRIIPLLYYKDKNGNQGSEWIVLNLSNIEYITYEEAYCRQDSHRSAG
jgi:hypothetical protein